MRTSPESPRPLTRRAVLAVLVALMTLPGCEWMCGKKKPPPPASEEPRDTPSRVDVQSVGREPRVKLEVARWAGLTYQLESETDGSFGVQGAAPARAPTSFASLHYEVLRGSADPLEKEIDGRKLRLVEERATLADIGIRSKDVTPDVLAKLNAGFGLLRGSTTRQLVAEDGEIAEATTELVGGMVPPKELKSFLDAALDGQRHFPFRLPTVPIGVGARWRFSEPLVIRGAKALQVADMTLISLGPNTARIGIRVRHQAPRQQVPHPLEPGLTATLDALRGDAEGEITIDRMTACVLSARLNGTSFLTLTWMDNDGKDQTATFMQATIQRMQGHVGEVEAGADAGDGGDAAAAPSEASADVSVPSEDEEDETP
jgi:hypothetical protein